jgi:starch synthase (maltosyl-transferring)
MSASEMPAEGRVRAVIENLRPCVDCGRFPVKRVVGESVEVAADCFTDGHDMLAVRLRYRHESDPRWRETPMEARPNDLWCGRFTVDRRGTWHYAVAAWVDRFLSWRHDFRRRLDAEDIRAAALAGAALIDAAASRAGGVDAELLAEWAGELRTSRDAETLRARGLDEHLAAVAARHPDRTLEAASEATLAVVVDRERARYSTWYELFPRSAAAEPGRHGTFDDVIARLPYIARLGFDVLYLPPIHPIGRERRKGPNNTLDAGPDDVGSPWAIGAAEGGHTSIHPALGGLDGFRRLVRAADDAGMEIALDIAFQCAPDHPYVDAHPEWFRHRPDGSVQYAENPPKKYQDIYPFDFESSDWPALWAELVDVMEFWIGQGVRIFRVDNPHTKAFPFWEWAIRTVRSRHDDVLFLAEAFTRPKVMHRLAKLGFSQSYTYFSWRNTKQELQAYFEELAQGPGAEYFRPNCWPNTPDILPEYLQFGGAAAFRVRLVLAATLAASYGLYGPAFELMEHVAREPGSEEYRDSEKYQLRHWDLERADSLAPLVERINRVRRENPALQTNRGLRFHATDSDALLAYSKSSDDGESAVLAVVNLDPHHVQSGWVTLDLDALDLDDGVPFQMHELLTGARYLWSGRRNFVRLDPSASPAHVFRVRRRVRTERDFDYFL